MNKHLFPRYIEIYDSPLVREGAQPANDAHSFTNALQQDIIDLRHGLDLLFTRDDLDAKRIAFVGHSFHAATGAVLAKSHLSAYRLSLGVHTFPSRPGRRARLSVRETRGNAKHHQEGHSSIA